MLMLTGVQSEPGIAQFLCDSTAFLSVLAMCFVDFRPVWRRTVAGSCLLVDCRRALTSSSYEKDSANTAKSVVLSLLYLSFHLQSTQFPLIHSCFLC